MNAVLQPTPEDLAVANLLSYAAIQWPGIKLGRHHRLMADYLHKVEAGQIDRLMIEAPPRHTKTLLTSHNFPAWYIGRNPSRSVIGTTYSQDRADDMGRAVRSLISSEEHLAIFGQTVMDESHAAKRFNVKPEEGYFIPTGMDPKAPPGGCFFVGRGGPITGRGAHLLLIDDPIKDRKEADSQAILRHLQDWYSSVLYTRLMPGAAIVLIMTRWAENDLAGWLLKEFKHEGWTRLRLPALAEANDPLGRKPGEALWPEQYSRKDLLRIKGAVLPRDWDAMYQQAPKKEQGTIFKREWFEANQYEPDDLKGRKTIAYGSSDFAVTKDGGDFTEHGVGHITDDFHLYITDGWSGQETMDVWVEKQIDMAKTAKPLKWLGESGVIRRAVEPYLRQRMAERKVFFALDWLPRTGDKVAMARSFQAFASQGRVHFPKNQWARRAIDQLCAFTGSPTDIDDVVDMLALFGLALDTLISATKDGSDTKDLKPFTQAWLEYDPNEHEKKPRRF